jgi:hypothetical protein
MYSHSSKTSQFKTDDCLNHDFCDGYDRQDEHSVTYVVMKQSPMHIIYSHSSKTSQFKTHNCLNHDFCDWCDRQDEHSVQVCGYHSIT